MEQAIPEYKLVLVGDGGVGKTTFVKRHLTGEFEKKYIATLGVEVHPMTFFTTSGKIKFMVWDTAGQERFRTITKTYYKGAHGIILTYDVTDENSFKNIRNWVKQIETNAQSSVCKVLVGNKCDREDRKVSFEEGSKLAAEFNMKYFETSAKTNHNVSETFTYLTKDILSNTETKKPSGGNVLIDSESKGKEKKKCC